MIAFIVDKRQAHLSALVLEHADNAAALVGVERGVADLYSAVVVDLSAAGRSDAGIGLDIERCPLLYRELAAARDPVRISGVERCVYDKLAAVEREVVGRGIVGLDRLYREAFL